MFQVVMRLFMILFEKRNQTRGYIQYSSEKQLAHISSSFHPCAFISKTPAGKCLCKSIRQATKTRSGKKVPHEEPQRHTNYCTTILATPIDNDSTRLGQCDSQGSTAFGLPHSARVSPWKWPTCSAIRENLCDGVRKGEVYCILCKEGYSVCIGEMLGMLST